MSEPPYRAPVRENAEEYRPQDVLECIVERVTFHNDDNGFCVLRIKARGHRDLITVVGHAATTCLGRDLESTWRGLIEGRSGIRRLCR